MDDLYAFPRAAPNPVDRHVGLRIRLRRQEMGVSQERLAVALGVTFQQVQKYERAANRISASKLWDVAHALQAPVAYFYEGLIESDQATDLGESSTQAFLDTSDGRELARAYRAIGPRVRRRILELVRAMAAGPSRA